MIYKMFWYYDICDWCMIYMTWCIWHTFKFLFVHYDGIGTCPIIPLYFRNWKPESRFGQYLDLSITYDVKYCWRIYVTIASLHSILKLAKLPVTIHPLPFSHRKRKNYDYLWKNSIHIYWRRSTSSSIVYIQYLI